MQDATKKTGRVLRIISICLTLVLMRTWYLAIIQHETFVKLAQKPKQRTVIERAERAVIQDRFGIPLAVNRVQYNAAICYAHIRQIPTVRWKRDARGKRVRVAARAEYIAQLAHLLAVELNMSATKIEDMIHAKASLLSHAPFVIKEELSEEQYYRLKALEKDWVGLETLKGSRREYPLGKTAGDLIGYLGNIDTAHYTKIVEEVKTLEAYLEARKKGETPFLPTGFDSPEEAAARLFEIQEKSYTATDLVGKCGIEASYEEALRGLSGKHVYEIDRKGRVLCELPASYPAQPAKTLTLTLSAELQTFAEQLLASNEGSRLDKADGGINEKWMRGGAAVALIPQTGEIVAMASYPRLDPNDFVPSRDPDTKRGKEIAIREWLESEEYLGEIWDGRRALKREYFSFVKKRYIEEKLVLSWETYIHALFTEKEAIKGVLEQISTVILALQVQQEGLSHPLVSALPVEGDRRLVLDLCHLVAPLDLFTEELIAHYGNLSLADYFATRQEAMRLFFRLQEEFKDIFYENDFTSWRKASFRPYLEQMRALEKKEKRYVRPYTDYLDRAFHKLWDSFWDAYRSIFLYTALTGRVPINLDDQPHLTRYFYVLEELYFPALKDSYPLLNTLLKNRSSQTAVSFLKTLRSFSDLQKPLSQNYPRLRTSRGVCCEKHLAAAFYPPYGYGFLRSQSYRQAVPPGSIFKLVTTYQMLMEQTAKGPLFNPLTIVDDWRGSPGSKAFILGYLADGTPLHRGYKGGRLPRSSHPGMGRLDLHGALEQSSNVYFSLLAGDVLEHPQNLGAAARLFGMGEKTGIDLPGEASGRVPNDLEQNKTGLYAFAIGQHTLEMTPLQMAVMTAAIATKGEIVRPHLRMDQLQEVRTIPFPAPVFSSLFQGMRQVVAGKRGTARPGVMRALYDHPASIRDYLEIAPDLAPKTGTAQALYRQSIAPSARPKMEHYITFVTIAYPKQAAPLPPLEKEPELVVAVLLRYRQAGLEGGPIAAQLVKKWRELKAKYSE